MSKSQDDALILFRAWYEAGIARLYKYVWYRVRDKAIAEELTAAVCERTLTLLDRYDPKKGDFQAWVFGIAHNEIRAFWRAQSRYAQLVSLDALPHYSNGRRPVEQMALDKEEAQAALKALSTLPQREQEIVALRYGAGFGNKEIAALTGLTENHVAVQLHRTLKKLRQKLEPQALELGAIQ